MSRGLFQSGGTGCISLHVCIVPTQKKEESKPSNHELESSLGEVQSSRRSCTRGQLGLGCETWLRAKGSPCSERSAVASGLAVNCLHPRILPIFPCSRAPDSRGLSWLLSCRLAPKRWCQPTVPGHVVLARACRGCEELGARTGQSPYQVQAGRAPALAPAHCSDGGRREARGGLGAPRGAILGCSCPSSPASARPLAFLLFRKQEAAGLRLAGSRNKPPVPLTLSRPRCQPSPVSTGPVHESSRSCPAWGQPAPVAFS